MGVQVAFAAEYPILFLCFVFVFGACVGSFLNVCICRLPLNESVVSPPSHCRACKALLPWHDNLPLLGYLMRRGRCGSCGEQFSIRYFMVELLTGLLAVALTWQFGPSLTTLGYFAFAAALVVITFIDLDHQIIPDVISLPGVLAGLLFSLLSPLPTLTLWTSFIGALVGGGILLAVALGYQLLTGREGMGGGDVKLLAMIGAFLGWRAIPFTIFIASFFGSLVGVTAMIRSRADSKLALPFGPFLSFGALSYLFIGEQLIAWYLGLL